MVEAEGVGEEVSGLVAGLNGVLGVLSGTERAFESGEYDAAVLRAREAVEASDAVRDEAVGLKYLAEYRGEVMFRNQIVVSILLVSVIVLLGFLVWSQFKSYFLRRAMGLRPEVSVDEP